MNKPPCAPARGALNHCARQLYDAKVYGKQDLHGNWEGWRTSGDSLRDPNGQRIRLARLNYLLLRERMQGVPMAPPLPLANTTPHGAPTEATEDWTHVRPSGPPSRL